MSQHDILVLKMMAGTILSGTGMVILAYGAGMIWRSWGWWHLS